MSSEALRTVELVQAREVYRYGVLYEKFRFGNGVVGLFPVDEPDPLPPSTVEALANMYRYQHFFDRTLPAKLGYRCVEEYSHHYPDGARANVYYNPKSKVYLKNPVVDKHAVLQSIAMNALDRSVRPESRLHFARSQGSVRKSLAGSSVVFSREAEGLSLASISRLMDRVISPTVTDKFLTLVQKEIEELMHAEVPRSLRLLCNDNTSRTLLLANGPAYSNVLLSVPSIDIEKDPAALLEIASENFCYTMIDQAHPTLRVQLHGLASPLFGRQPAG